MHWVEPWVGLAGFAVGSLAGWLWPTFSERLGDDGLWQRFSGVFRLLLSSEEETDFFREYLRLIPVLLKYVSKKLLTVALAFAPVVVVLAMVAPQATRIWDARVTHVAIAPRQQVAVDVAGKTLQVTPAESAIPYDKQLDSTARVYSAAGEFHCRSLMHKQAYSPSFVRRCLLKMLGFEMLEREGVGDGTDSTAWLLLRPSSGDNNFLWPYLNDWECVYLISVSVASLTIAVVVTLRRRRGSNLPVNG